MLFKNYGELLAVLIVILFIAFGIHPIDRAVWIVEVIPIVIIFFGLVFTCKLFRFSNYAYTLMAIWMVVHTIGAHYTFANVPFGFVTDYFGFERNNFDRIGHFVIGLYAFASAELLTRKKWAGAILATVFSLFFILSVAAGYEIVEWLYAVVDGGNTGIEFLGSQGDLWDAQKDMLSDGVGAIAALILFWIIRPDLKTSL